MRSVVLATALLLPIALLLPACAEPPPPPPPPPPVIDSGPPPLSSSDRSRLAALGARFDRECDRDALADLRALRERHGTVPDLVGPLTRAFQGCKATSALADLLAETLPEPPTRDELLMLGATYLRAARYHEAAALLRPLSEENPRDRQAAWLAGFSLYHAGMPQDALPLLITGRRRGDPEDVALLIGMAKLDGGDVAGALEELERGAVVAPHNPSLQHALTKAYSVAGRPDDAAAAAIRTRQIHAALGETEARRHRMATLSAALNHAWTADRLDEAEELIDTMWTEAPPPTRRKLLGFRVELYRRTGRAAEEAEARAQLEKMEATP